MLLVILRTSGVRAGGKTGDRLFFVVFVDFEVVLLQVVDIVPFFVGHYGVHQDQARFLLNRLGNWNRLLRGRGRSGLVRRRFLPSCRLLRGTTRGPKQRDARKTGSEP